MKFVAVIPEALFQSNSYWSALLIILGILVVAGLINKHFKDKKSTENKANDDDPESSEQAEACQTLGIMLKVLTDIGCQPKTENQEYIDVDYQGAHFRIEIFGMYARIWYPSWGYVVPEAPDYPNIAEAVNLANFRFRSTVLMTRSEDDGSIALHSRIDVMLHPACPDNDKYVRASCDELFDIRDAVVRNCQRLELQQQKEQQSRRPVGFDTNSFDPANVDVPTDSDIAATAAAAAADKTNETKA